VLAAAVQLDAAAAAAPRRDTTAVFRSTGYPDVVLDLGDLSPQEDEKGTTEALVRGIAAGLAARGATIGGFTANGDSTVLPGAGLSSSAAAELLIARIFDGLYGEGKRPPLELARIGQEAENNYFGKPSGLMDQAASAYGSAVAIDFGDPEDIQVKEIPFDLAGLGYVLCVVNTGGSHADLTPDYSAIPGEMKALAAFFGKSVLREINADMVRDNAAALRKRLGDRAILRALHFFNENKRVDALLECLLRVEGAPEPAGREAALGRFLALVNESGDSSWELLQNIYPPGRSGDQGISLALALSRDFLGNIGACRVHGGGFAGTIQAYIPTAGLEPYRKEMEAVFGLDAVTPLLIRPAGAVEILF
jgi:galactokinase